MNAFFKRLPLFLMLASVAAVAQTPWIASERSGNEVRFLYGNLIRSYNLDSKSWLPAISLPRGGATAMAADATGAVVAYGTGIYRYGAGFTGETMVGTVSSNAQSVFLDGNLAIVVHSTGIYGRVTIFNRTTGSQLYTRQTYVDSLYGASHAPGSNRLYGRTQGISPGNIVTESYTDAGVAGASARSPYHGTYPNATRTWCFPDESRVVDSAGTVYTAPGLNYFGSFAGTIGDIAFNGDVPVILRGGELIAYSANLLEAGRAAAGTSTGAELQVTATEAFVFSPGTTVPSVNIVLLATLNAPEPNTPVDPNGLAFTVDDAFPDKDGNLLIFSKSQQSLFRWSPVERKYTGSFPLLGVPDFAAYSKETHSAYFAYETQVVRKMDLAAAVPKEVPFLNLPSAPRGFTMAGEFPYVATENNLMTFMPAGESITTTVSTYQSGALNTWDPVKRRVYHFRDSTSPNDLHYETLSATGAITGRSETPYHGEFQVSPPIRVRPDGEQVVIGSGVVFDAADLTKSATLANGFTDAQWFGGSLVTARAINGVTQLQTWSGPWFLAGPVVRQFSGMPVRLFTLDASQLLLISLVEGVPRFTILDAALETIFMSLGKPLAPSALAVTSRGTGTVALAWADNSDNETGFRIDYRTTGGEWLPGATTAANATAATVAGLTPGTNYEFRVLATLEDLAAESATVAAKTLGSADEPIGEPYELRITRIFANTITLEWRDNADNETGFQIFFALSPGGPFKERDAAAGSTSLEITGLTANTTYYFNVQAVNGGISGDLSAQVSAKTRSTNTIPSPPSTLRVAENAADFVRLEWVDTSANEEVFRIERSAAGSGWIALADVPYNTTTFTDTTVTPATAYNYRVKTVNASGSSTYRTVNVTTSKRGGEFAGYSIRAGDVYYFAFSGPDRIERYDLTARAWLPAIPLEGAPSALWADESGIFAAEQRALIRFALDGSGRAPIANAETAIRSIFTLGDVLVFGTSGSAYSSLDKKTYLALANFSYGYAGAGISVAPGMSRAFFRSTNAWPSDIHYMEIGPDGKLVKAADSPYHASYPGATRTFVFPNQARVVDDSGTVYSTDSLSYTHSLGQPFADLAFHGGDIPIVLRGNKLQAYSNVLLEAGSFTLDAAGLRLAVAGDDAVVFTVDAMSTRGLTVQAVPIADFAGVLPGQEVEPGGLAYTPDDIFVDRDGGLLMFSKANLSLFRWSPAAREYVASLPLVGSPKFAAYSAKTHRAYFAYDTQMVREMDLNVDMPAEKPLFTLPQAPTGLATAGEFIFAADPSGSWSSHYVYSPAGTRLQAVEWNYYSRVWEWDPVKRRMYFFRDDQTPGDLHYEEIDTAGNITGKGETPYHGTFSVTPPIRASRDGGKVAIGSGVIFETTGMTRLAALPTSFVDAMWRPDELLTLHASAGQTQIQRWNDTTLAAAGTLPLFEGTPLRLLALNAIDSALVTLVAGVPRIYLLNNDLSVTFIYKSQPRVPTDAAEDEPFAWSPKFLWSGLGTGPLTITAPVVPGWLHFQNGIFAGIPGEGDGGDQVSRTKFHRIVIRAVNGQGLSEEKEIQLPVAWRNDAPVWTSDPPPVHAKHTGAPTMVDLSAFLRDPDGRENHLIEITGSTIFSKLKVSENGMLEICYAPHVSGTANLTAVVTDASGASASASFQVTLPNLPVPVATVNPAITFSRATGLYCQEVTVKNVAARAIGGFDLTVTGLRSGVSLHNATKKKTGGGVFCYKQPLAAGQSVKVVLKYFAKKRGTIPQPKIVVSLRKIPAAGVAHFSGPVTLSAPVVIPVATSGLVVSFAGSDPQGTADWLNNILRSMEEGRAATSGVIVTLPGQNPQGATDWLDNNRWAVAEEPFAIRGFRIQPEQAPVIEFHTERGRSYRVQYSDDAKNWKTCPQILSGIDGIRSWSDTGPPRTECPPAEAPARFYRLERLAD